MKYDYRCDACGALFEVRATIAEKERGLTPRCAACGSPQTTQVYAALNVITHSGRGRGPAPPCCGPDAGGRCCR